MSTPLVLCVMKTGGRYNAEWVRKLRDGVYRNAGRHYFLCLTDDNSVRDVCDVVPLRHSFPGWWSKIELFRHGFEGTCLYIDLDSVIVGSLDPILEYPHGFTMAHEFWRPNKYCSTVMAWNGNYRDIYEEFVNTPKWFMSHYDDNSQVDTKGIGDQAFIEDYLLQKSKVRPAMFKDIFHPKIVASYKVDECYTEPPKEAAIVAFHGEPKPNELTKGWVPKLWK